MQFKRTLLFAVLALLVGVLWFLVVNSSQLRPDPKIVKVALREVGHRILLANRDSISRVLPVKAGDAGSFEVSFERELQIHPDTLVSRVKSGIARSELGEDYLVEVLSCDSGEVAYSYRMRKERNQVIVPCGSRLLPRSCYVISVSFSPSPRILAWNIVFSLLLLLLVGLLSREFINAWQYPALDRIDGEPEFLALGRYRFYPDQLTLEYCEVSVTLSRKEGEVLAILANHVNQVVRREELSKRVWEDHGVVVGRSLDTYISKLRKHLKKDASIEVANVHGVGYKLIDQNRVK